MFEALKKLLRYKRSEVEASLNPTPECAWGGVGEVEVEVWSDGGVSIEASIKHSGAPDGTELEVYCSGNHVPGLRGTRPELRREPVRLVGPCRGHVECYVEPRARLRGYVPRGLWNRTGHRTDCLVPAAV